MIGEARGFEGTGISGAMLDSYITGNYGADQEEEPECWDGECTAVNCEDEECPHWEPPLDREPDEEGAA